MVNRQKKWWYANLSSLFPHPTQYKLTGRNAETNLMWELLREAAPLCSGMLRSSGTGDGVGGPLSVLMEWDGPSPQPRPPSSCINDVWHFLYDSFLKSTSWNWSNKHSLPLSFSLVVISTLITKVSQNLFLIQTILLNFRVSVKT